MKKTKLALLSMIIVTTLFCFTFIFYIQFPFTSTKNTASSVKDVVTVESDAAVVENPDSSTHSLSIEDTGVSEAEPILAAEEVMLYQENPGSSQNNSPTKETDESSVDEEKPKAQYADIGISVAKDYVNIRKEPSTDSEVLGKLYRDSACTILDTENGWYYVESGTVTGYVKAELIKTGLTDDKLVENYGILNILVAVDGLNVREDKSTDSKKLSVIYQNEKYPVEKVDGDWILIYIEDENIKGYVKTELTELSVQFKEAISKEEELKILQLQAEERAKKETAIVCNDGYSYTAADLKLLACLIHAEAGTQSYEGKLAVANVVLNRMKSSKYPDTIKQVIYQAGQFSVAKSGSLEKQLSNYENYSSNSQRLSIKAARDAFEGMNNIDKRMYFNSHTAAARKGYTDLSSSVKIGGHVFW